MRFDLLVPTGGNLQRISWLLECIALQTVLPERIVVLLDQPWEQDEIEHFLYNLHKVLWTLASRLVLVHHRMSDFEPQQGIGYVRQYLLEQGQASYLYMIDDDNLFTEDFFERTIQIYGEISGEIGMECVLSPTIMLRKTETIQSQGILGFMSYIFPKYRFQKLWSKMRGRVQMIGLNSLFGPRSIFQKNTFDERFRGSYEDVDYTRWLTQQGEHIIVSSQLKIYHMERLEHQNTISWYWANLATMQLWTPLAAYARSRNRVLFVKKHATHREWLQYIYIGIWVQTIGFLLAVWRQGAKERRVFWRRILQGTRDGIRGHFPAKSQLMQ